MRLRNESCWTGGRRATADLQTAAILRMASKSSEGGPDEGVVGHRRGVRDLTTGTKDPWPMAVAGLVGPRVDTTGILPLRYTCIFLNEQSRGAQLLRNHREITHESWNPGYKARCRLNHSRVQDLQH